MGHESRLGRQPSPSSSQWRLSYQEIINDLLEISLDSYLFNEVLERILIYLSSKDSLHLAAKSAVFLVDQDKEILSLQASIGLSPAQIARCNNAKFGDCHCGRAATSGAIHFFPDPSPLKEQSAESVDSHGHYCVPIMREGNAVGVFALYVSESHQLSLEMEQLLGSVANIIASIIESKKMDQQLIELVNDLRASVINLREEKFFSESILQSLSHGLIVIDPQGNIQECNPVARQMLKPFAVNFDGHTLTGQNLADLLDPATSDMLTTLTQNPEVAAERELCVETAAGEQKIFSCSTAPRRDTWGKHVGMIISMSDVTEMKNVHKEMEKMNRLSTVAEIASAVAHEVRNPLAGIKIMAQSIEEEASGNDQQLECSRRIIRQVDRLNELLNEFFSYARPVIANKRPTSLTTILSETRPLINARLVKKNIDLIENIESDLPQIIADPNQMQQVFLNLMLNAIDAIRENGAIEIHGCRLSGDKLEDCRKKHPGLLTGLQYVLVEFSDNGAGMPTRVAEKAFEPFFTTKTTGTGLGLSIVYRTLRENDAIISIASRPGRGTTFTMFFQAST